MIQKIEAQSAMPDEFDPYRKWLGIPPSEQPANYYRLLGIPQFENDPEVIENAADRQMAHVRTFQSGPHGRVSQRILNELSAAKLCLLKPEAKSKYDDRLREPPVQKTAPVVPLAPPASHSHEPPVASAPASVRMATPVAPPVETQDVGFQTPRTTVRKHTTTGRARARRRNKTLTAIVVILLLIGLLAAVVIAFQFVN